MIVNGTELNTGEVTDGKPYESEQHANILKDVSRQVRFVQEYVKTGEGKVILGEHDGDTLVQIMTHLMGFYEELGTWTADERLRVADMKNAMDSHFAQSYVDVKSLQGETNETARMKAKLITSKEQEALDTAKRDLEVIDRWRKALHGYWDTAGRALSHEKSLQYMNRGNGSQPL